MSPIHDQSYRHYAGGKAVPGRSWAVIAWAGIKTFMKKRAFLGLMIFALAPFIVRAVQLWISANYPLARAGEAIAAMAARKVIGKLVVEID